MSGAPARGTAPRRLRRHHHHHHHHHQHRNNREDGNHQNQAANYADKSKTAEENRPKVNPIFLWALQREQRIIEVRCEDYDKRNRIKLTKTAHGWRSIPRTASNVYNAGPAQRTNGHIGVERVCESPSAVASLSSATSSPISSRWSPATISSSSNNLAIWSVSSTRSTGNGSLSNSSIGGHCSAAISSPSQEGGETGRELVTLTGDASSIASRSRNPSDGESVVNDYEYACPRSAARLRRIDKKFGERRQGESANEAEKRAASLNGDGKSLLMAEWKNGMESNRNDSEEEVDSAQGLTETEETSLDRMVADETNVDDNRGKRHRRRRNSEIRKRKKRRRNSVTPRESTGLSVMSSPRSWERLMNGTRFLSSGPAVDRMRDSREDGVIEDEDTGEIEENDARLYGKVNCSSVRTNHFGSIDLERAKKDQQLQPRVVLEQLRLTGSPETAVARGFVSAAYEVVDVGRAENRMDERSVGKTIEAANKTVAEKINSKQTVRKESVPMSDKSEIRDILNMLDSTGSPVLATDTPTAHLPSSLDSTKTSYYENRDYAKSAIEHERSRDEELGSPLHSSSTIGQSSMKNSTSNVVNGECSSENTEPTGHMTVRSLASAKCSDSAQRQRVIDSKAHRRENACETVDSSSLEFSTSSEILEALRSTPGLSVSITTKPIILNEPLRQEPSEHQATKLSHQKRQSTSALNLERILPNSPRQSQQLAPFAPYCDSSEVTCSQDTGNELTLEAILATPTQHSERLCGPGLAAIVNRLSSRNNRARDSTERTIGRRLDRRTNEARLDAPIDEGITIRENGDVSRSSRLMEKSSQLSHRNYPRGQQRSARRKTSGRIVPPAKQLRHLMDNSVTPIPDPLLVPRELLPALAASPAVEIPKLLAARPELRLPEALARPDLLRDPDLLVISLAHLQQVLDQGDGSVCEYTYRPPHPMALDDDDDDDECDDDDDDDDHDGEDFSEEDELVDEGEEILEDDEDEDDDENEAKEDREEHPEEEEEEEEDQDVPEQSLDLHHTEPSINASKLRGIAVQKPKNQRVPPKLISCKPIGNLMPGPIDLSRGVRSTLHPNRSHQTCYAPGSRQSDISTNQLPPPPLLRVRSGLMKQEPEVTSTEISTTPCLQDDSHLWHPLFGSSKRQMQQQQQQQQQRKQQQAHRTPWHRTTLAS